MTTVELKPDRWTIDVSLWDHKNGTRRASAVTIEDDAEGCVAEELLDAMMSVAAQSGLTDHVTLHAQRAFGQEPGGLDALFGAIGEAIGRKNDERAELHAKELATVIAMLDEADFPGDKPGAAPSERLSALLGAYREAVGRQPAPERDDDGQELPRTLREPQGEDPADEARETLGGRPVEDVGLPEADAPSADRTSAP